MRRSLLFHQTLPRWTLLFVLLGSGCTAPPPAAPPVEPPMVPVATPVESPVTDNVDYTGRTDAVESVDVRARVTGYLGEPKFKPGSEVKAGDLLFVIDERPYQAILAKAEGQ